MKDIMVNEKVYNLIISRLGYKPSNLIINNMLPDTQGLVMNKEDIKFKPFLYKEEQLKWDN